MTYSTLTGPSQTFRTMDGKPIYWRDKQDFVHACEGSEVHRGVTLIWTLCERDVPANKAYKCDGDDITCATCHGLSFPSHESGPELGSADAPQDAARR